MAKRVPSFSYNGESKTEADDSYWYIYLLSSGTLTFPKAKSAIDVFLLAGGAGGNGGESAWGGSGGASGRTLTLRNLSAAAEQGYQIIVGSGGDGGAAAGFAKPGGATSAFGNTVAGGTVATSGFTSQPGGSIGGSGGGTGGYKNLSWAPGKGGTDGSYGTSPGEWAPGSGQGTTTRAFGEVGGTLYATGGDGGDYAVAIIGANAVANTGDGGHGGGKSSAGGKGGSGIVIIRGKDEDLLPLFFNNTQLSDLFYNGTHVTSLVYNGTRLFFEKLKRRACKWLSSMNTGMSLKKLT